MTVLKQEITQLREQIGKIRRGEDAEIRAMINDGIAHGVAQAENELGALLKRSSALEQYGARASLEVHDELYHIQRTLEGKIEGVEQELRGAEEQIEQYKAREAERHRD